MRIKTVSRTYFNKKLDKYVTKTYKYEYNKYTKRGKQNILVTKAGKVHEDRIDNILENTSGFGLKEEIKTLVRRALRNGERLTERKLRSLISRDAREKMIINTGLEIEDALKKLKTTEEEYYNDKNWNKGMFTNSLGETYKFEFNYQGDVWIKQ